MPFDNQTRQCHITIMPDKLKRPRDANQLAHMIVGETTGEITTPAPDTSGQRKGGLKGGKARAISMTPTEREEIAKLAASVRWKKG